MYGSLKMLFRSFWNLDFCNLRMTLVKKLFGTETSKLQVNFYSKIAFQNLHFLQNRDFILCLIRGTCTKFW